MSNGKPDNPNDIDSDIDCDVLRMFIDARDTRNRERGAYITKALGAHFRNKDKGVYYVKSKQISEEIDDVLSSKQLAHGFSKLENSDNVGFTLEKYSDCTPTMWKVTVP